MKNSIIDIASIVLTTTVVNQTLELICGILTAISIVVGIVLRLIDWYRKSKADGVITVDEAKEGLEIIKEELDKNDSNKQ